MLFLRFKFINNINGLRANGLGLKFNYLLKFNPFPEFPKSKNRIIIEQYRYELIGEVSLESTTPYVLAQASSVSNDAQGDTLFINGTTYTVVEDHPNG